MKAVKLFGLRNYKIGNRVLLPINPNQIKTIAVDFSHDVTESNFKNWQFVFGSRIGPTYSAFSCIIRYDKFWLNIGSTDTITDIPISVGNNINYKNSYYWNYTNSDIHTTFVGGNSDYNYRCSLLSIYAYHGVGGSWSAIGGFVKVTILDT